MITLYTTPSCKGCIEIKNWLKERGLEYTEGDISKMHVETGSLSVPTLVWGEEVIVGFNQKKLNEIYQQKEKQS